MFLIILIWVKSMLHVLASSTFLQKPQYHFLQSLEIYGLNYVLGLSKHFSERGLYSHLEHTSDTISFLFFYFLQSSNLLSINLDERVDNVNKQDDCWLHWQSVLASYTVWHNGALLINITQTKSTTTLLSAFYLGHGISLLTEWINLAPYKHVDRGVVLLLFLLFIVMFIFPFALLFVKI